MIMGFVRRIRLIRDPRIVPMAALGMKKPDREALHTFLIRIQNMHHLEIEKVNRQSKTQMMLVLK
jgi:hypothetical protein